ncbi:MAG: exonuclease domain-containing protein [Ilumatobacteraceae bacterium]
MDDSLARERFAVVDVETSGLDPVQHRVLQIGVVVVDADGTIIDRWSTLVRPDLVPWRSVGPTEVHGIRRRNLWRAPRTATALAELARRLDSARVVAHNAPFDLAFLTAEAERSGIRLPLHSPICTLRLSRALDPGRRLSHRLVDVCDRYGVSLVNAHDALADAEAAAAVLPHLLRAHGVASADQLASLPPAS